MTRLIAPLLVSALVVSAPLSAQSGAPQQSLPEGWRALNAGDAARAASLFHEELVRRPRDPVLHFGAGVAAHLLGREQDASASLTRALDLEPRLTDAARLLGQIRYRSGNVEQAIRIYEQALVHAPGDQELEQRLERWRKEAALHRTLTHRVDGRFSVIFDGLADSAIGERVTAALEAAYWRIGDAIGGYPSDPVTVTLYTEQQFRDITRAPEWSGGAYDGRIRVPVKGALQDLQRLNRVLAHELTHALVSSLAPRGVPAWLHEGLASYFEADPRETARAARLLKSTGLLPWSELTDSFQRFSAQEATVAYLQSLVLVDVLMQRVGTRMALLLQTLDRGRSLDETLLLFGISMDELEADVVRRFK